MAIARVTATTGNAAGGGRGGGVSFGRFDQLRDAARTLVNTVPAICAFLKPRMTGTRHFEELADRAVITWSLSEPVGGIQDFTWTPTVNRFQAVLRKDGSIEFSYEQVAARDAIVGLYPLAPSAGGAAGSAIPGADVDLSALTPKDGPFPLVYESFHYLALPKLRDLSCTVIKALGDQPVAAVPAAKLSEPVVPTDSAPQFWPENGNVNWRSVACAPVIASPKSASHWSGWFRTR